MGEKKIDNISTFLLRMYSKMDQIDRHIRQGNRRGGGGGNDEALTALAQESYDILTLLPTYIENTKDKVSELAQETKNNFAKVEYQLVDSESNRSLASVLKSTETNILGASKELKEIVIESGHMAESLFDSVMDTKKKLEFGVQQIIFKVEELVQSSGGEMDEQLKNQFEDITRTILSNQTEALSNLTKKVEKEI